MNTQVANLVESKLPGPQDFTALRHNMDQLNAEMHKLLGRRGKKDDEIKALIEEAAREKRGWEAEKYYRVTKNSLNSRKTQKNAQKTRIKR